MCFSATASFVASGSLGYIGHKTKKQVREKSEKPFAAIPMFFAAQQFVEGVVWLSFYYHQPVLNVIATYVFLIFSNVLWPFFIPLAVMIIEPDLTRKKLLKFFVIIGATVSSYLLYSIILNHATSQVTQNSISYTCSNVFPYQFMVFYLVATCVSCLFSTQRLVRYFGIALIVSCFAAYLIFTVSFFSVWCFFAAIMSVIVYCYFKLKYEKEAFLKRFNGLFPDWSSD